MINFGLAFGQIMKVSVRLFAVGWYKEKMMPKQPRWTKRCPRIVEVPDVYEEIEEIAGRRILTKRSITLKKVPCNNFMPDEHDRCDNCLKGDYSSFSEARVDYCDHEGRGDQHIDLDTVVEMIRKAEKRSQ